MTKIVLFTLVMMLMSLSLIKHALTVLMNLELLVLLLILLTMLMGHEIFFSMILICVGACEGAVGLSALISMNRMKAALLVS